MTRPVVPMLRELSSALPEDCETCEWRGLCAMGGDCLLLELKESTLALMDRLENLNPYLLDRLKKLGYVQ